METKERKRTPGSERQRPNAPRQRTQERPRAADASRRPRAAAGAATQPARRKAGSANTGRRRTMTSAANRRTAPVKQPTPDVVYVQPTPFNKYRFLLQLATVVAVVLALLFGMSIFFKVKTVTVVGNEKYTAWDIRQASGIQDGENLLTISEPKISSKIRAALPYVDYIRIGIKLPDTVKIEIVELDVVYAAEATDGSWWLIRSDGEVIEKTNSGDAGQHTKILGIQLENPKQGEKAMAAQPSQTDENGETLPVTQLASEQLNVAISIAQFLEGSGVIGEAASIDVSNPNGLELWYGERYQVMLGDAMELGYKIRSMKSAIDQMGDYQSGILDVSFTVWPEEVGYTPFS